MQLEFFTCSNEDFEEYLRELGKSWETSSLCSTSKGKAEYEGSTSFYQYAHFIGYEVELLANKFSLDMKKTLGFFYYLISTMPQYGEAGLQAIKEYLEIKGEKYSRVDILALAALINIDDACGFLFNSIQDIMRDLFDVEHKSECKEIEFVKTFYYAVKLMKKGELIHQRDEMKEYAINLINESYDTLGSRVCIKLLKEKADSFYIDDPMLNNECTQSYFDLITSYEEGTVSDYPIASFIIHNTQTKL